MTQTKTRTRRTEEDRIADLEAKIAAIKARAERKKVKKDPSLRHISAACQGTPSVPQLGDVNCSAPPWWVK